MNLDALTISYEGVDRSPALTQRIIQEAAKLSAIVDRITSCRIVIARSSRHHHHGSPFEIHIELAVPRTSIVVRHSSQDDAYAAVADAFQAARRRLEDYARKLRGEVKAHPAAPCQRTRRLP